MSAASRRNAPSIAFSCAGVAWRAASAAASLSTSRRVRSTSNGETSACARARAALRWADVATYAPEPTLMTMRPSISSAPNGAQRTARYVEQTREVTLGRQARARLERAIFDQPRQFLGDALVQAWGGNGLDRHGVESAASGGRGQSTCCLRIDETAASA
jgi:hypothetical protein